MATIFEADLERLYQQTIINNDYGVLEKTTPPTITGRMNLGVYPLYPKTSQLESQLMYNGNAETQQYLYPPLMVNPIRPEYYNTFNYALDQYITKRPVDVSGNIIPNNQLRVIPNRGADTLYRPQIIQK